MLGVLRCISSINIQPFYRPSVYRYFQSTAMSHLQTMHNIPDVSQINLTLTEVEKSLFEDIASMLKANKLDIVVRVAGGWVRDKVCFFILLCFLLFCVFRFWGKSQMI